MTEIWKSIEGYETYSVSTFGNVRNDNTLNILKGYSNNKGRLYVDIYRNEIKSRFYIHRLVGFAFIKNSENKKQIDHIDNNPLNNNLTNLRWATNYENQSNTRMQINNKSGVKGVCWNPINKNWRARINNKDIGSYKTIEEATIARQTRDNELFGSFTNSCEKLNN